MNCSTVRYPSMPSTWQILVMLLFVVGTGLHADSVQPGEPMNHEAVIAKLETALPSGWSIVETKTDVLPEGHYWGLEYEGPKGIEVVLRGQRNVLYRWKDQSGSWHEEPLAKEALRLSLMPVTYDESWRRFFVMKRPKTAKLLFSGKALKVYSHPSLWTPNRARFDEILKVATSVGWQDSPSRTDSLSWKTWKSDLERALRDE
jgi:hypothetical protein